MMSFPIIAAVPPSTDVLELLVQSLGASFTSILWLALAAAVLLCGMCVLFSGRPSGRRAPVRTVRLVVPATARAPRTIRVTRLGPALASIVKAILVVR